MLICNNIFSRLAEFFKVDVQNNLMWHHVTVTTNEETTTMYVNGVRQIDPEIHDLPCMDYFSSPKKKFY